MNKLLIGLLIVAAGAGAFFLLRKKKETTIDNTLHKEWIVGNWKLGPGQPVIDSVHPNYQYHFMERGLLLSAVSDSVKADTSFYEWGKTNELVIKKNTADSTGHVYAVTKLTSDSLQLQMRDSVSYLFLRTK